MSRRVAGLEEDLGDVAEEPKVAQISAELRDVAKRGDQDEYHGASEGLGIALDTCDLSQ
jgi:hypothetical protein